MIRSIEPIISDIIKWSIILTTISFLVSIVSIFLFIDIEQENIPYLALLSTAMSNLNFLLGSLSLATGLIITFFKPPNRHSESSSEKPKFIPQYKNERIKKNNIKSVKPFPSSPPLFSEREKKLILTGLFTIGIAFGIWIIFLFLYPLY